MKNKLCLLLAALLLVLPLASCSNSEVNTSEEKTQTTSNEAVDPTVDVEEEEETSLYLDSMPEQMDFEGTTMRFIVEEGNNGNMSELSIRAEEDTGDVVDSAVFNRNITVCDRLNIAIELEDVIMFSGLPNAVRPVITSGSDDYDIIGTYQYYGIVMAAEGLFLNLARMPYNDFSREYWGTQYMDNMSYKGIINWATGDLALRYVGGMYVTYVNGTIWNNFFSEDNIYTIVDEGEWTLDKLYDISSQVYIDENGDSKMDEKDTFGFLLNQGYDPVEGVAAGSMVKYSERDEDGVPYITFANDRTYKFYEKLYNCTYNNPGYFKCTEDDSIKVMTLFSEGRTLFTVNKLYQSSVYLREMEDDFMIIPVPKLEVEQEHYNTMLHDGVTLFGLPITNSKIEASSATLEALASQSAKEVTPAYYDVSLKVKYSRDSDSGRMIDLIHENVSCDFCGLYSNKVGDIIHSFRTYLSGGNETIASRMEKTQKAWNKSLEKLLQSLEDKADK